MAKEQKEHSPPIHTIEAPKGLIPIMQAFHVDSEKVAKTLISEAARTIYGEEEWGRSRPFSKSELDGLSTLMKGMAPMDSLETLYAAQMIVGHMLGMRELAEGCPEDQRLGLNFLKFSGEAMRMFVKKRSDATQNIVVTYHRNSQGNALVQTVMKDTGA